MIENSFSKKEIREGNKRHVEKFNKEKTAITDEEFIDMLDAQQENIDPLVDYFDQNERDFNTELFPIDVLEDDIANVEDHSESNFSKYITTTPTKRKIEQKPKEEILDIPSGRETRDLLNLFIEKYKNTDPDKQMSLILNSQRLSTYMESHGYKPLRNFMQTETEYIAQSGMSSKEIEDLYIITDPYVDVYITLSDTQKEKFLTKNPELKETLMQLGIKPQQYLDSLEADHLMDEIGFFADEYVRASAERRIELFKENKDIYKIAKKVDKDLGTFLRQIEEIYIQNKPKAEKTGTEKITQKAKKIIRDFWNKLF